MDKPSRMFFGLVGAFHLMRGTQPGRASSSCRVSGPIKRRSTSRAIFGSWRRSAFHVSTRCSSAARNRSRSGGAGRAVRNRVSIREISTSRSRIFGAVVVLDTPAACRSIKRSISVRSRSRCPVSSPCSLRFVLSKEALSPVRSCLTNVFPDGPPR